MVWKSAGTEKELLGIKGEHSNGLWKARQSKNCVHDLYCSPMHPNLSCVSCWGVCGGVRCWKVGCGPREGDSYWL